MVLETGSGFYITRDGVKYELYEQELFQAYEWQERKYNIENIQENMENYLLDEDYARLSNNKEFIEEAALQLKENEESGMNYETALENALETTLKKYNDNH